MATSEIDAILNAAPTADAVITTVGSGWIHPAAASPSGLPIPLTLSNNPVRAVYTNTNQINTKTMGSGIAISKVPGRLQTNQSIMQLHPSLMVPNNQVLTTPTTRVATTPAVQASQDTVTIPTIKTVQNQSTGNVKTNANPVPGNQS